MELKAYKLRLVGDLTLDQEMMEDSTGTYLLKSDVEPILKAYQAMINKLKYYANDVRDNMEYRIKGSSVYKELMEIPDDKLPMHINDHDINSPQRFIILSRLGGEDPITKDLSKCIELLWDVEFDMEAYKNLGYNDGLASATSSLLDEAGLKEESLRALDALYNID